MTPQQQTDLEQFIKIFTDFIFNGNRDKVGKFIKAFSPNRIKINYYKTRTYPKKKTIFIQEIKFFHTETSWEDLSEPQQKLIFEIYNQIKL